MVADDGTVHAIPADAIPAAMAQGYRVEGERERVGRLIQEQRTEEVSGIGNTIATGIQSGANALSLGGYGALVGAAGGGDLYNQLAEAHPNAALAGTVVGTVAPALLTAGGSLLARGGAKAGGELVGGLASLVEASPAALTMRIGTRIAGQGGERILGRAAATTAAGAFEGAAQSAGAYISDVALGDRDLSADGFMGAMGQGAMWGGAAGGALSIAADSLTVARRLFPKQEMTKVAVKQAEEAAAKAVKEVVDDSDALVQAARTRLRERRGVLSVDPAVKQQLDDIALQKARDLAESEVSAARSKAAEAGSKAEIAATRLERAKQPKTTRKAMLGEETALPAAAVGAEAAGDAATLLERQLGAMKSGIDAGETLGTLAAKRPGAVGLKPTHVEDALNAHIAKVDPEAARMVRAISDIEDGREALGTWLGKYGKGGGVGRFERSAAARETADSWRSQKAGYYSKVPEGEAGTGAAMGRGREWNWRGSEAERTAAEDAFYAGQRSRETGKYGREALAEGTVRVHPGERIDDQIKGALGTKVDDIGEDITDTADAVGRVEAAHADLADALGPSAPMRSQERAAEFRKAENANTKATTTAAAQATADAEKAAATIGLHGELPGPGGKMGVLEGALKVGDVVTALHMMGIPVPDPAKIPIIGPVLKAVLQARVVGKAFGRFGGKVAETAETVIASKSAATKQRVYTAVDAMLEGASKGVRAAAPVAGVPAAVLAHSLFDDGTAKPKIAKGDVAELFAARSDELNRAMQPGAVMEAVRMKVRASDPALVEAIAAAQERKLKYLYDQAPKPDMPPGMLAPKETWVPSGSELRAFSRVVAAADDPAGVLERVAKGGVVLGDEIDAVKAIYPALYEDARSRLVTQAIEKGSTVSAARRVQLSLLFDVPLDGTMRPDYVAFLQQDYKATPPPAMPQAPMPQPTIAADVTLGARVDPIGG